MLKKRKGIILAGGSGTRLFPSTLTISKQLLPIYDKPMIYYPLTTLMLADIKDILIISTPHDIVLFKNLLNDGSQWGINIDYAIQEKPEGLAQALIISEDYLKGSPSVLILGDNIFYGQDFSNILKDANNNISCTSIFAYRVKDPERYGVVEFDNNYKVISIEEKPEKPKSNYAITGLYFYDENAPKYAKTLKKSHRGELEITDLNKIYLEKNCLNVKIMSRGFAWLDTGTHKSLLDASIYVSVLEERQGIKIACPEEIAFVKSWISKKELQGLFQNMNNEYGEYLKKII
tara:strand:+ start:827 stop:1696 length:870 start_codon:yes stop_codon:yes gene_type:complete